MSACILNFDFNIYYWICDFSISSVSSSYHCAVAVEFVHIQLIRSAGKRSQTRLSSAARHLASSLVRA